MSKEVTERQVQGCVVLTFFMLAVIAGCVAVGCLFGVGYAFAAFAACCAVWAIRAAVALKKASGGEEK